MSENFSIDDPSLLRKTVLVIDPDPAVSAMLSSILSPRSWDIRNAPDNNEKGNEVLLVKYLDRGTALSDTSKKGMATT
jgi:hypothetical protein